MSTRRALHWILENVPGNVENELTAAARALVSESKYHMPHDIQELVVDWDKLVRTLAYGGARLIIRKKYEP